MSSAPFFFQQPDFIFRNGKADIISFKGLNDTSIHFTQIGQLLLSSPRSPFGSFVVSETTDKKSVEELLEQVLLYVKAHDIELIEIKCYPEIYAPQQASIVSNILDEAGFSIEYRDVTQVILLNENLNLYSDRKRMIKGSIEHLFEFKELNLGSLPEAYDLFLKSRHSKGYPVTMSLKDFFDEFSRFPMHYKLFGVLDRDRLIAASVVILINDEIIYYFFSGDDLDYRKQSPTTYLVYNLYQFAKKANFKFIDMGISTDKGILNQGLYNFKKSFGTVDSLKLTFIKNV